LTSPKQNDALQGEVIRHWDDLLRFADLRSHDRIGLNLRRGTIRENRAKPPSYLFMVWMLGALTSAKLDGDMRHAWQQAGGHPDQPKAPFRRPKIRSGLRSFARTTCDPHRHRMLRACCRLTVDKCTVICPCIPVSGTSRLHGPQAWYPKWSRADPNPARRGGPDLGLPYRSPSRRPRNDRSRRLFA
jgi:hypothetical protein